MGTDSNPLALLLRDLADAMEAGNYRVASTDAGDLRRAAALIDKAEDDTTSTRGLSIEHRLGELVFKYIDRLNDQTPEDSAEKIVAEFLAKANPMLNSHFDASKIQQHHAVP